MSVIIDGTNGISDVDGSASTPAIRGTDANTGIFFPAADTIAFSEGGAESMRLDSTGDVNLYNAKSFKVYNPANTRFGSFYTDDGGTRISSWNGSGEPLLLNAPTGYFTVSTNGSERMRIDSSGRLLVGLTASETWQTTAPVGQFKSGNVALSAYCTDTGTNDSFAVRRDATLGTLIRFYYSTTSVGTITTNGTNTSYNTSSDYRLKENIAPMTGALDKVKQLKPCTFTWKSDGSNGQGFIAHELQEIVSDAVTGTKDAVDKNGNPDYQGVDVSFLVATLTAAIQELNTDLANTKLLLTEVSNKVEAQAAEIAALKNPPQPVIE